VLLAFMVLEVCRAAEGCFTSTHLCPCRYYNCYTLSVDLTSVCDAPRQAVFTASPNDPNLVDCSCPGDPFCSTYNLVNIPRLFLTVNVWLTAFTNQGGQCAEGQVGGWVAGVEECVGCTTRWAGCLKYMVVKSSSPCQRGRTFTV
jgi:hypothetical protein